MSRQLVKRDAEETIKLKGLSCSTITYHRSGYANHEGKDIDAKRQIVYLHAYESSIVLQF